MSDGINRMPEILGIAAFDLDGTLLRGRTVCEVLAEPLGRSEEMRRFETEATEAEVMAAPMAMAQWYRGHQLSELKDYLQHACWAPGAQEGIAQLLDAGIEVAVLSVTWGFAVRCFAEQLGVKHCLGTDLLPTGEIRHCWGRTKAHFLRELMQHFQVSRERVAAIGDSTSDIPMLEVAALRFFVGASLPEDLSAVHHPNADIKIIANEILAAWS